MSTTGIGTFVTEKHEVISNGLDIFSGPEIDSSLLHGKTITVFPNNATTELGPYEFTVPSDGQDWTDLPYTRLEGLIEILKPDGSKLKETELNAYVNLLPHALFRQIEVYVNGTLVTDLSAPTYPYKAVIEKMLSYPANVKKNALQLEMYHDDTLGKENVFTDDSKSFSERHKKVQKGGSHFSTVLHVDFLHSVRYLISGCEIKVKLIRNTDDFVLLGATKLAKVKISNLKLLVRRVTVEESLLQKIESTLATTPAIFPLTPGKIKTHTILSGTKKNRWPHVYDGVLPRSIIFCFTKTKGFDGDIATNPFVFEPFGLNEFQLYINGEPHFPTPLQPDFDNDNFCREYRHFLDNVGVGHGSTSIDISMEEFKTNKFFIPIDFTPSLSNGYDLTPPKEGFIDVSYSFKTDLNHNITMIAYSNFNEILTIDKDRRVILM